jgi:hypothetical protein
VFFQPRWRDTPFYVNRKSATFIGRALPLSVYRITFPLYFVEDDGLVEFGCTGLHVSLDGERLAIFSD